MTASFETFSTDDTPIAVGGRSVVSRAITLASGQNLRRGSVLGKVTIGGRYVLAVAAASDGSQTPVAILAEDCNASGGDAPALAHFEGSFCEAALTIGLGVTPASAREALRSVGINLQPGQA